MLKVGRGHRILATVPIEESVVFFIPVPRHHRHGLENVSEAPTVYRHLNDDHCEPKRSVEIKRPQIALRNVVRSVVSQVSELHCSRDSAINTVRSLTSQGAISPAVSTRGAEQTTDWPSNNVATSEHARLIPNKHR